MEVAESLVGSWPAMVSVSLPLGVGFALDGDVYGRVLVENRLNYQDVVRRIRESDGLLA